METPLINGNAFDWAAIKLVLFGKVVEGITAIKYEDKQEKKNNYGRGNKPVNRGRGNKEFSGSLTLDLQEVQAIQKAAGKGKSLTDIAPFDIQVVYFNDSNQKVVDKLRMVEFLNNPRDAKQGDSTIPVELELIIGDIQFNA